MPKVSKSKMGAFLAEIKQDGVKTVYADPKNIAGSKMDALWTTKEAKYVIIKNNATKYKNKKIGKEFQVRSNEDIEDILQQAKKGLDFVIIEVKDWKIIPLENIIAKLHKLHTRIFAIAKNPAEVRKMFSILDVGVDGSYLQHRQHHRSERFYYTWAQKALICKRCCHPDKIK